MMECFSLVDLLGVQAAFVTFKMGLEYFDCDVITSKVLLAIDVEL